MMVIFHKKDLRNVFRRLQRSLVASRWFEDDWEIYNRGAYLQLYKTNWHNNNQGGVHFETFIEAQQIKQKSFPVCLHAEEDCPSRDLFTERLLELEGDRIKGWKGYQIATEGYSVCQKTKSPQWRGPSLNWRRNFVCRRNSLH